MNVWTKVVAAAALSIGLTGCGINGKPVPSALGVYVTAMEREIGLGELHSEQTMIDTANTTCGFAPKMTRRAYFDAFVEGFGGSFAKSGIILRSGGAERMVLAQLDYACPSEGARIRNLIAA
ncbi:hypothetical protein [Smaragdicoccus niigatensis]|uniref:hypothetical protein n=1 Tax=Smaragdicoccus niigatensis TaxID=359359 RepID=UPI000380083F|nr:hypothetical protein [Smaragdicoccus niigatensis]